LVSAGFLAWIIYTTDWPEVLFYFIKIDPWYLILYIIVLFIGFLISSYKWKLLAEFKKINLPHWEFFKLYFVGTFINNFMPSFIAGDAYKAYEIGKQDERHNEKYTQAASTVMMDRITGFIGATILLLLFNLINFQTMLSNKLLLAANIIVLTSFVIDIIVYMSRKIKFLKNFIKKIIPGKIIDFFWELSHYDSKIIRQAIFYSIIFSLIGVAILNYILFMAMGIEIGLLDYLSVIFLIAIISSIPISVNNIGIKEWAYVTFFGLFGLNASAVLTVAIISRSIQMIVSFAALPAYLQTKKSNQ